MKTIKLNLATIKSAANRILSNRRRFLFFVFGLAVLVRIFFILALNNEVYYFSDARHYDAAACRLVNGEGFDTDYTRAPFYPVVMAGIYYLFGHSFIFMRLFQAILGGVLCILIFLIGATVFNSRVGAVASIVAIFFPHFIFISGLLYPTLLFTVLMALTTLFILKTDLSRGVRNCILAGECAGLAALSEASMIFFLPFLAIWIVAQFKLKWTKRLIFLVMLFSTTILIMSPWLIRGYKIYGRLTLVRPLPHTVLPNLDDSEKTRQQIESGWASTTEYRIKNPTGTEKDNILNMALVYFKNPFGTIRHLVGELGHFWALYPDRLDTEKSEYRESIHSKDQRMARKNVFVSGFIKYVSIVVLLPIFVLAFIGLIRFGLNSSGGWLLFLLISSFALGYSMLYAEVRYRIPVEPYILIFASAGLGYIIDRINTNTLRESVSS